MTGGAKKHYVCFFSFQEQRKGPIFLKHSVPERAGVGKVSGVDGRANRSGCARLLGFLEYVLSNRCSVRSIEVKLFDLLQTDKPTNGPTDQPTDRLMDMRY